MVDTAVLVHGAWHSPWCRHEVVAELERQGIRSVLVDLPSCRAAVPEARADMHADAAEIRRTPDAHDDVVLVAHSYAGIPATEAAAGHPAVRHLVCVAAYIADEGRPCSATPSPTRAPTSWTRRRTSTSTPPPGR
ncbi:alpha/beta hydrolase [Streptomyces sp. NRRL S-813]|uniref:alpha/beta hydrolase n=1 Tax=Streptomyces sp. NRRL S-813 TaxID=1463919 RepID=UPI00068B788F|nr:alpha/beta hydrolase [Streptomyces sp. NRRL S-813]